MPTLPLDYRTEVTRFVTAGEPPVVVPISRLACVLAVGNARRWLFDAWVDTGSPLTFFPPDAWSRFADQVEWIGSPAARYPAAVGGSSVAIRFGRVQVAALTADLNTSLPPVIVSAMFAVGPTRVRTPLIGMTGGVLAGRRLVVEPDLASARLEAA